MLNRFAGDSVMTDNVVKRMRELAPSIYSEDDAVASKANELLMVAKTVQSRYDQLAMLRESLQVIWSFFLNCKGDFLLVKMFSIIVNSFHLHCLSMF